MYCGTSNHKFFVLLCYDGHDIIMFYDAYNTSNIHMQHIKKMVLKLL
jgi:hypothetical protein